MKRASADCDATNRTTDVTTTDVAEHTEEEGLAGEERFTWRVIRCVALLVLSVAIRDAAFGADPVVAWNRMAREAIRYSNTPPPEAARQLAILHLAIYDAVQALGDGEYLAYRAHANRPAMGSVSVDAAAAAAGNTVLRQGWPDFTEAFDAELQAQILAVPDGEARTEGIAWGRQVAFSLLRERAFDGAQYGVDYQPVPGAGRWVPTPPLFASALLPQWPGVRPFSLNQSDQFRPPPPPPLNSPAWVADFDQIRQWGSRTSSVRTRDQTEIAWFWADGVGTETPPGHWNDVARQWVEARDPGLLESARLFAALNMAMADAGIAAWDSKFAYDLWRPITAIREASTDGNPETVAESNWAPLIVTPPFPEYVSGHSTFSAAAAAVLTAFHGDDRFSFTLRSQSFFGVERRFERFSEAAAEAGMSRIYGGIHFMSANEAGQTLGGRVGRWVVQNQLLRRSQTGVSLAMVGDQIQLRWPSGTELQACDRLDGLAWKTVGRGGFGQVGSGGVSRFFRVTLPPAW